MNDELPAWMGNLHLLLPHQFCGAIVTVIAIGCGAVIGVERGKREKPAGLRAMMLICLGASIFAQASLLVAGGRADPGRISAQVVTGVGFLGAGAIMHGRGAVTGFTTAAAIWVVAAIGVILGSGYAAAGVFFTLLVVGLLAAERTIEAVLCGRCQWASACVELEAHDGRTRWLVQEVLDAHHVSEEFARIEGHGEIITVCVRYCLRHRQHRAFVSQIISLPQVVRVSDMTEAGDPLESTAQV